MNQEPKKVKIHFYGGTGSVTGANFLMETDRKGEKFLIDCGLFQGSRVAENANRDPFPYDPTSVDMLFITHAHLDHIGRIPKLVKDGFKGRIISTPPTREISELSLIDSIVILSKEAERNNQEPLYTKEDVERAMELWETKDYHEEFKAGEFGVKIKDAGHILGSSMYEFSYNGKKIVFTGDLGNSPAPLLRDTEVVDDADYLIMESVYGDRNHEDRTMRHKKLEAIIKETMARGGTLMIPAFSIERTQEILYEIENMMESSQIPLVPVYLDSPLAIGVTKIYKKYDKYFNKSVVSTIDKGDGLIFRFPQLIITKSSEESKAIEQAVSRKIIIAGSGMSNGGRIMHHEIDFLPDPKSTLLLVGYQVPGSLGRILQDGAKRVTIYGQNVKVMARVENILGYSAHKDSDHLLEFVADSQKTLKEVFCVMGEPKSSLFLVQRIRDYLNLNATAPEEGEVRELEL